MALTSKVDGPREKSGSYQFFQVLGSETVEGHFLCLLLVTACLSHGQLTFKGGEVDSLLEVGDNFHLQGWKQVLGSLS